MLAGVWERSGTRSKEEQVHEVPHSGTACGTGALGRVGDCLAYVARTYVARVGYVGVCALSKGNETSQLYACVRMSLARVCVAGAASARPRGARGEGGAGGEGSSIKERGGRWPDICLYINVAGRRSGAGASRVPTNHDLCGEGVTVLSVRVCPEQGV
jgi:hypothetical protein